MLDAVVVSNKFLNPDFKVPSRDLINLVRFCILVSVVGERVLASILFIIFKIVLAATWLFLFLTGATKPRDHCELVFASGIHTLTEAFP